MRRCDGAKALIALSAKVVYFALSGELMKNSTAFFRRRTL
jgi:hypothetical protein